MKTKKGSLAVVLFLVFLYLAFGLLNIAVNQVNQPTWCEGDGHHRYAGWWACGRSSLPHEWGPLFHWLMALFASWTGSLLTVGRVINVIAGALLVGLTCYAGIFHFESKKIGVFAAVLTMFNAYFFWFGALACTDMLALFFVCSCLFLVTCTFREDNRWQWSLLAGLAAGLACLTRNQSYFVLVGLIAGWLLLHPAKWRKRFLMIGLFALGFVGPMLIFFASRDESVGYLVRWLSGADNVQTNVGRLKENLGLVRLDWPVVAAHFFRKYYQSVMLLTDILGYYPLLGIAGLCLYLRRGYREISVVALSAVGYFLAIGWFPDAGHPDTRRFFLMFIPLFGLLFSWAFWRFFHSSLKLWKNADVLIAVIIVILVLVNFYYTLPRSMSHGEYSDRYLEEARMPAWTKPNTIVFFSDEQLEAQETATEFVRREGVTCQLVATNVLAATTGLRNIAFRPEVPIDNEWVTGVIAEQQDCCRQTPEYLMLVDDPENNRLAEFEPVGENEKFRLRRLYKLKDYAFYRIEPNSENP